MADVVPDDDGWPSEADPAAEGAEPLWPAAVAVVDVDFGSGWMDGVEFDYGRLRPPARERSPYQGGGFSIELPAVLDLLELIAKGQVNPRTAREALRDAAEGIYLPFTNMQFEHDRNMMARCERDQVSCPLCERRRGWFEGLLDAKDDWWERYNQPEVYPFIAGSGTVHTVACSVTRRVLPNQYERPSGDDYGLELRRYAHCVDASSGRSPLDHDSRYPRWKPLNAPETRAWMEANTGPKGGRLYKLCGHCEPAL
ncbi:hypothetical protein ACWDRR_22160 [Kitasatospora sp. NPDC003701]